MRDLSNRRVSRHGTGRRDGSVIGTLVLVALAAAGCTSATSVVDLGPSAVADFSAASQWKKQKDMSLAPRVGFVSFQGGPVDVPARATIGAFGRLLETDERRVEVAVDLVPSFEDDRTNLYASLTGDYVGFFAGGTLFWKTGGGLALERRDDASYVVGLVEAGMGVWLPVGKDQALVVSGCLQVPVGDVNPSSIFVVTAGYEF